jgi:Domain of unknown function (DUF4303)
MPIPSQTDLADAIAAAAQLAFRDLFAKHPERFYYCSLVTTGKAHAPFVAAWSHEALARKVAAGVSPTVKWSYADSPYFAYGYEEYFDAVRAAFARRPAMEAVPYGSNEPWQAEYELRLAAMETAMARLDVEGLFGVGPERNEKVVLVEVMPPDHTNTERARRLNSPAALAAWLAEAAE